MRRLALCLSIVASVANASAQTPLKSKTTYAKAYGETQNAVQVDPAKDLPSYPAVEPADALATWEVKKGFKLQLAANEPQVRDPIAISFDERGRMFVCEMIDYSEMRDETPHWGRVSMLEDLDGDGVYEKSTVFADNLPWPTGLIWANGGLFVGATPDIWRLEDQDGDGKAEVRKKAFTGFGTGLKLLNVQGLLNSFQWGQDNRVHVLAGGGNRGIVTCPERPELKGMELGGRDFWFDPVSLEFGLEAGGAQYGMSFDNYGRKFGCSNSDHLQHWIYDDRYAGQGTYAQMPPARRSIAADGGAAEVFRISPDEPWRIIRTRWRIAGVVKGTVEGGGRVSGYFTGATGTTIYRGDAYGPEFVNNSFTGDAGGQLIHRKVIKPAADGISLVGERPVEEKGFEFAASRDTWVRVVNFANAPDGCLHVCDMYRQVIEHPWSIPDEIKQHLDLNKGNDRGRIYRIVPEGAVARIGSGVELAGMNAEGLVKTLSHSNGWHRDTAQRLLYERQDKAALPALKQLLKAETPAHTMLHVLGALDGLKTLTSAHVVEAINHSSVVVQERAMLLAVRFAEMPEVRKAVQGLIDRGAEPRLQFVACLVAKQFQPALSLANARKVAGENELVAAALLSQSPVDAEEIVLNSATSTKLVQQAAEVAGAAHKQLLRTEAVVAKLAELRQASVIAAYVRGLGRAGAKLETVDRDGAMAPLFVEAATVAADRNSVEQKRLEALELVALAAPETAGRVLTVCLEKGESSAIQKAAVSHLASSFPKLAAREVMSHWSNLAKESHSHALEMMLSRDDLAMSVMKSGQVEPGLFTASQVQSLIKHKNKELAALAQKALASVIPPSREQVMEKFKPSLTLQGDALAGEAHFMARCMACHVAKGQGIAVGPDLVTVKTRGKDGLLSAIIDPHKEVASQYIAYTFNTKVGQTLAGIITADTADSVTIKMMGGADIAMQRSQISGSSSAGLSLMPDGLEQGMTVQDMADLIAFIEAL